MKNTYKVLSILSLLLPEMSNAALLTPVSISGTGSYNNDVNLIANNVFPNEFSAWTNSTNVYWSNPEAPVFTLDFGSVFTIEDLLISVDNNDNYHVEWSQDLDSWSTLFDVSSNLGEVTFGMDTMSTDSSHAEYISALDFSSVQAQYLRISATGGDGLYSIGEIQAFGVPEPTSLALLGLGIFGFSRKKAQ